MNRSTRFVGLDTSKAHIAVAIAESGREPARYWGTIPNTPEAVRQLFSQLGPTETLQVCYEAGPTGYGLYRQLTAAGIACTVVAPALMPRRPGDRVKTDRRDALRLAELFRAGELQGVWVPTAEDEALRDLVRAREDAVADRLRARHQLSKFLLRRGVQPPAGVRPWSAAYRRWLDGLSWTGPSAVVFRESVHTLDEIAARIQRLEQAIREAAATHPQATVIQALQALRGVQLITAVTVVSEVGSFARFRRAGQVMGYAGLVPREYSSGTRQWRGGITKTGNAHLRRVVVEAAWAYRHPAALKATLRARQAGQPPEVQDIAWRAQVRLHQKWERLIHRGKGGGVATAAVARELLGFMWAVAQAVEGGADVTETSVA